MEVSKKLLKNKYIKVYKAYILSNGDAMQVEVDGDIFFFDFNNALTRLINDAKICNADEVIGKTVSFLEVKLTTSEVKHIVSESDGVSVNLRLKDYEYSLNVFDYNIKDLKLKVNPNNNMIEVQLFSLEV